MKDGDVKYFYIAPPPAPIEPAHVGKPTHVVECPRRHPQQPMNLRDYEVTPDNVVDDEGDLIHCAMFTDWEPTSVDI